MRKKCKQYEGFSLVEMLLTIAILAIVTLLVATTLTTLIKVSLISNNKNQARNDVNFIMELMNRSLGNTNVSDVMLYNSNGVREFNRVNQKVVDSLPLGNTYQNPTLLEGVSSNEIHVRSYGYNVWSCIGYFLDEDGQGYLLKTSVYEMDDHSECFSSDREDAYVTVLHNYEVDVKDFSIEYLVIGDDADNMFVVDTVVEPKNWPVGFNVPVNREITRQITVSSQGLTWY
jgi:prepilin-type N-terminal cleavage/methylation domain-containing protein